MALFTEATPNCYRALKKLGGGGDETGAIRLRSADDLDRGTSSARRGRWRHEGYRRGSKPRANDEFPGCAAGSFSRHQSYFRTGLSPNGGAGPGDRGSMSPRNLEDLRPSETSLPADA